MVSVPDPEKGPSHGCRTACLSAARAAGGCPEDQAPARRDRGSRVSLRASTSPRNACRARSAAEAAPSTISSPTSSERPRGGQWARARRNGSARSSGSTSPQFFSDATRELLQRAAQTALEWGSLDLDTRPSSVRRPPGRCRPPRPRRRSTPIPRRSRRRSRRRPSRPSGPTSRRRSRLTRRRPCSPPTRSPASSGLLRRAGARAARARRDDESEAGQLLQRFGVSHTKLRGAVIRGVEGGGAEGDVADAEARPVRARPDRRRHARASSTRSSAGPTRSSRRSRSSRAARRTTRR